MGATNRSKSQNEPKSPATTAIPNETNIAGKHSHDRLLFLTASWVGCLANVTLKNHESFTGIFSAASLESSINCIVLKMTKRLQAPTTEPPNGTTTTPDEYLGYGDDHVMTFDMKDVITLEIPNATTDRLQQRAVNGSSIRTDTDISGNLEVRERKLEAWQDASAPAAALSMNGDASNDWDQFKTNERLFGLSTDYDETMYTTAIDRSARSYKDRAARADKLAREIENSETTNSHIAEERNLMSPEANGLDEETKYSGVTREYLSLASSNPIRYTPPARRAPTSQITVAGAPVDPAIISSSLIRPEPSTKATDQSKVSASKTSPEKENTAPTPAVTNGAKPHTSSSKAIPAIARDRVSQKSSLEATKEYLQTLKASTPGGTPASRLPEAPPPAQSTATNNVEEKVQHAFKDWAATEKLNVTRRQQEHYERQRLAQRKDREYKFNDLKKFSVNFHLKTAPPQDILGILARDKEKQKELQQKAQQELEAARTAKAAPVPTATEAPPLPVHPERQATRASRGLSNAHSPQVAKIDRATHGLNNMSQQRVVGNLGQRLLSGGQYNGRNLPNNQLQSVQGPRIQPAPPTAINTNMVPGRHGSTTPASAVTRMRAQAMEFKPNPSATTFTMPGDQASPVSSPARSRARSDVKQKPVNRVKFFGGKKPEVGSKKPFSEGFNPIARMISENTGSEKAKDFLVNCGIPQAYRTVPVWPVSTENEDKDYIVISDKMFLPAQSATPGNFPMAHQHQLPPHLNQNFYSGSRTPSHNQNRQPPTREYFDPHRMHQSNSQSSVPPSPSMRGQQMMAPQSLGFRNENGQAVYHQPGTPARVPPGAYLVPTGGGGPPMMISQSNQGHFIGMSNQGPMIYPPGPMYQGQGPPQANFNSPRQGHMMIQPGQPQMPHMQPQFPYQMQMQIQPGYQQQNHMQMRGSAPMAQQGSYGSPQMGYPMPQQQRGGPNFGGGYPQQSIMQPGPGMGQMPSGPSRHPSDQSEVR